MRREETQGHPRRGRAASWVGGGSAQAEEGQAREGSEGETPALRATFQASRAEGLTAAPSPWPETRTPADPSGGQALHGNSRGRLCGAESRTYGQTLRPEGSRWLPAWAEPE